MSNAADITLTCRQCGKQFMFTRGEQEFYKQRGLTSPTHCPQCRLSKKNQLQQWTCCRCGGALNRDAPAYCDACFSSVQLDFEQRAKAWEQTVNEIQAKLLTAESLKADLAEALRQKELLVAGLGQQVHSLIQDLERTRQPYASPQWPQQSLNNLKERLEALEQAQHENSWRSNE